MAQMIASMSGAMVNLLFIMLLGRVYENLALRLTTWGKLSSFILFWLYYVQIRSKNLAEQKIVMKNKIQHLNR